MKFIVKKKDLLAATQPVMRAIDSKTTLPVLGNILMKVDSDKLEMIATNLEVTVRTQCDVSVESEGSITIPAKLFSGYISLVGNSEIECELGDNNLLKVVAGSSKTEIKGISAEEFPVIPGIDSKTEFTLAAPVLARALEQVVFAASSDPTRPVLNAVLFLINEDVLKIVATNSYQLAERKLPLLEKQSKETKILMPVRAATELAALLAKEAETVKIQVGENQASFEVVHTQFVTRLTDGKFPDYEQIIPKEIKTTAIVPTEDLIIALRRIGLFADSVSGKARMKIDKDKIVVGTDTGQLGRDEVELSAKVSGDEVEVAMNVGYVVGMLGHAGATEVEIGMVDATRPVMVRPVKDKSYTYVVMPLKLD